MRLKRILGTPTALLIGMGVAIGSGIFRTPGEVAAQLHSPILIIGGWVLGGIFVLMAGLVTAELATRFPSAGGDYVFLREAYGRFAAFFFGWAFTFFVVGVGGATIAAAFGDFACDLFGVSQVWSGTLAAGAIVVVTVVNASGLRSGAGVQNTLTLAKITALLALAALGFWRGTEPIAFFVESPHESDLHPATTFALGLIPIFWAYSGSTDPAKLAEEIKDVRRALPRALIGSAIALTALYVVVNLAMLRVLSLEEMSGVVSVPGSAMERLAGSNGRTLMLVVAMLVCLGALSSTVLATIRVTFALARDGLTFRFLSRMSGRQAPVPALLLVGAFSVILVMNRNFGQIMRIYFLAGAVLYGLSYASLIVFRVRDRGAFPAHAFRCPAGPFQAVVLILIQLAMAAAVIQAGPRDSLYTIGLLVGLGALYHVWKRWAPESGIE